MLRQVNIDGVLYKIGDSRFEGDNLAYIQLPETITVGTPLTDLAPIQKALDSTDGSLLYAPSLNVFFAPTASSTPATTRIWASTTGDKGYQLKATLNASGVLQSAVVNEAAGGKPYLLTPMNYMAIMNAMDTVDPTVGYITDADLVQIAKDIYATKDDFDYFDLQWSPMGPSFQYTVIDLFNYDQAPDGAFGIRYGSNCSFGPSNRYETEDIIVYVKPVAGGVNVVGIASSHPLDDLVHQSIEYMEVPTGHAPHTCLEASISGTTLNITHKNESHISSVIHVPNSMLFTSPNAFELQFAPVSMFTNDPVPYTPDAKIEISKDGLNWTQPVWDENNGISLVADTLNPELGKYSVFIRSDNYINKVDMAASEMKVSGFSQVSGADIEVSGILDAMWGSKAPRGYDATSMFSGMMFVLIGAKNLVFPTTVGVGGYMNMFKGCVALASTPALPATTLPEDCYNSMFWACVSLTQAPTLPAITLADYCCSGMFYNCESLTQAPTLPAITLADHCYDQMFKGCSALINAPALPATILADNCYNCMFQGCASLIKAPELPATTLVDNCYHSMFFDCTSLAQIPALPATTLVKSCYEDMFRGCTSLTSVPTLPMESLAESCYRSMFKGCTSLTKPMEIKTMYIPADSMVSMFEDCTGIKWATEGIPYSIEADWGMEDGAVMDMFKGNLGDIPGGTGTPENWETYYLYTEPTEYVFTWNDAATEGLTMSSNGDYWEYIDKDSTAGQDTPWLNDEWIEKVKGGRTDFTVKMNITSKDHVVNNVLETFVYDEDYTGDGAAFKSPNAYIEFYMSDEYNPSPGMDLRYGEGIPFVFTVEWTDELKSQLTYNSTWSCWEISVTDIDTVLAAAPWICENFAKRERFGYGEGDVVKIHIVSPDGTYNKEFTFDKFNGSPTSSKVAFKSESPEGYFSIYKTGGDWKKISGSFY